MSVTLKEIAKELGVSSSTVSRVLNEKQSAFVSEFTRDRILQTAFRMGYRPNRHAQALKGKKTNLIGVFLPDGADPFFQEVLRHLRRGVEQEPYELVAFPTSLDQIRSTWRRILRWNLEGLFVFDALFYVDGLWEAMAQHLASLPPMVGLFSPASHLPDYVTVDFQPAMHQLLTHLGKQGCRRLGYLAPRAGLHRKDLRYRMAADFADRWGQELIEISLKSSEDLIEEAHARMRTYLDADEPLPDALLCWNDEIALGAYRALRESGIGVPDGVALAGCGDGRFGAYLETPLTSLALPVQQVCEQAWGILKDRMERPDGAPQQRVLEAELRLRASCRIGAGNQFTDAVQVALS